jgi:hypothetical protein
MKKLVQTCVCLLLAIPLGAPNQASARKPQAGTSADGAVSQVSIGLLVDTSEISEQHRPQLEHVTSTELTPMLESAGYKVVDGAVDLILRVRFVPLESAEDREHGIHFEFIRSGAEQAAIPWVHCPSCSQTTLREKFSEAASPLLDALAKEVESLGSTDTDDPSDGSQTPVTPPPPPPKPIGPLGGTGIGVAALGLGALAWGAVEFSRGRVFTDSGSDPYRTWTDHTPRGSALIGIGVGGVAIGGALLVTDLVLRAKRRKQLARDTGTLVPLTSPSTVGAMWIQRF